MRQMAEPFDGVAQYTRQLIENCRDQGIRCTVLSGVRAGELPFDSQVQKKWDIRGFAEFKTHMRESGCAIVHLQYVPQVYAPLGLSCLLTAGLAAARWTLKRKIVVTMHEVREPADILRPWRWPIILLQSLQSFLFLCIAHQVIFTTPVHLRRAARNLPWLRGKMRHFGVSSNLPQVQAEAGRQRAMRAGWDAANGEIVIGTMAGTLHRALNLELLIRAAAAIQRRGRKIKVVCLGAMRNSNPAHYEELNALAAREEINLVWSGPLDREELAHALQSLDFYTCFFADGVTPRQTSVMAALQQGSAVLCGPSVEMLNYSEFDGAVIGVSRLTPETIASALLEWQGKPVELAARRAAAAAFYAKLFSAERMAEHWKNLYERL